MEIAMEPEVLSRNPESVSFRVSLPPGGAENAPSISSGNEPLYSENTLSMDYPVEAGAHGISRKTVRAFTARLLFGAVKEPVLVIDGLPLHGTGATVGEAQEDLVIAMEEMLDELEEDVRVGTELAAHLLGTLAFVRNVFDLQASEEC